MAHIRQSRPDSGLDFQVKILKTFKVDPSSLGIGKDRNLFGRAVAEVDPREGGTASLEARSERWEEAGVERPPLRHEILEGRARVVRLFRL